MERIHFLYWDHSILIEVLRTLTLRDLCNLSCTCRAAQEAVSVQLMYRYKLLVKELQSLEFSDQTLGFYIVKKIYQLRDTFENTWEQKGFLSLIDMNKIFTFSTLFHDFLTSSELTIFTHSEFMELLTKKSEKNYIINSSQTDNGSYMILGQINLFFSQILGIPQKGALINIFTNPYFIKLFKKVPQPLLYKDLYKPFKKAGGPVVTSLIKYFI